MADLKRLAKIENILYKYAEDMGLKHCDIEWDVIKDQKMFEIMAYRIPGNISNWKYGRDYERQRTISEKVYHGLPYEVVINSDPSRAYLMKSNTIGVQMLVMAHVIGHVSFFTMNKYYQNTNKNIIQIMDLASKRFDKYERSYGLDEVEKIVDAGHALQFHSSPFEIKTEKEKKEQYFEMKKKQIHNISKASYKDITENQNIESTGDIQRFNQKLWRSISQSTPIEKSGDLLRYIIDYSNILEDWQKDILEILRKEGQYFWPQMTTKYMNEGFATYVHQKMIERLYRDGHITHGEHAEFNYSNSLVKAKNPKSMNPYLIGSKIFEDICDRWDKGKHGDEYENCKIMKEKENWDTKAMEGNEKILSIIKTYQDWFFMMDFLTVRLVDDLDLYIYALTETPEAYQLVRTQHTAEQVRDLIVNSFNHSNIPKIDIININFNDSGRLLLKHQHVGVDLQLEYAKKTMEHIHTLWGRDCVLKTIIGKKETEIVAESMKDGGSEITIKE